MGLDLYLLPIEHDTNEWGYSHTMLCCNRDRDLFQAIIAIEKTDSGDVPLDFSSYLGRGKSGEHAYGKTQKTPYGDKLRAVRVGQLLTLFDKAREYNIAAWAYLERLPHTMRVALYWH